MTASTAVKGYGVTLTCDAAGTAYPIMEITDYGDFGISRSDIEVTSHDSDSSSNEYIPGLREGGELSLTGNYIGTDTSGQVWAMVTNLDDGSANTFTLTLPNTEASTFVFEAYTKSYKVKADLKGALKLTLVLKITGLPVFTV
jgi:hypothetical protein